MASWASRSGALVRRRCRVGHYLRAAGRVSEGLSSRIRCLGAVGSPCIRTQSSEIPECGLGHLDVLASRLVPIRHLATSRLVHAYLDRRVADGLDCYRVFDFIVHLERRPAPTMTPQRPNHARVCVRTTSHLINTGARLCRPRPAAADGAFHWYSSPLRLVLWTQPRSVRYL